MIKNDALQNIRDAAITGFIDGSTLSLEEYQPKLLVNSSAQGKKVLTNILSSLNQCDEFFFSVAFVTNSGVATLISALQELEQRGVRGKIIASQYQNFTEPRALRRLIGFKNIDVRIMTSGNFHAKGYLFRKANVYSLIVGSSNLTANALCLNQEWNLKVSSTDRGALILNTKEELERLFEASTVVDEEWITEYEKIYLNQARAQYTAQVEANQLIESGQISFINRVSPNKMQVSALQALEALRCEKKNKALLISATGTGKTYLSAFDVFKVNPKRFLFVVHRENIAKAAMQTFHKVFGVTKTMGLLTGHNKDLSADYIFCTIWTLAKEEILHSFDPHEFEYIVIDEVHRSGADSYLKVLAYFQPDFLLGMSATPERTDGIDIFKAFDYNIAFEIRLHTALEENMLAPFHYYGVTDIEVDGQVINDFTDFNNLVGQERVERVLQTSLFYGCDRGRIKGLIFCSRKEEAKQLSTALNRRGLKTIALTGESSEEAREEAIQLLETDIDQENLDYILSVDIFNEGVDIPTVNQIIMLRPTQSAIVFVQQLGRGLRKAENKDYLTVIDFIGNYQNNYLVPIALYGDHSYNKDTIRKFVSSGSAFIPGASTVDFDIISRQRIYESIDTAKVNSYKELKQDYQLLKFKLGHIPTMMDFVTHGSRDPYTYVDKEGSLYAYVCKQENDIIESLSADVMRQLSFFAKEICNGKRIEDVTLLNCLLDKQSLTKDQLAELLYEKYMIQLSNETFNSIVSEINGGFLKDQDAAKYYVSPYIEIDEGVIRCTDHFNHLLQSVPFKESLIDAANFSIKRFESSYDPARYYDGFSLYHKYSRKDVCRLLNWEKNEESTMYGYRIKYNTCSLFVTYSKSEDISGSTKYEDYFISDHKFHWMTRNRVTLNSSETQQIRNYRYFKTLQQTFLCA